MDSHKGGTLSEMAPEGTSIPNDAGKQNIIPSVPRPDQKAGNAEFDNEGLAQPTSAFAADNATALPRGPGDTGATGEVVTGTGNSIGAGVESKGNTAGANYPGAGARPDVKAQKHSTEQGGGVPY
ncbi:hypothetical protein LTS12_027796 [Elasticomyces elasticus]|nr:hypothetical protein LTS12_027796 [Elasticomyces elasticus]